MINNQQKERVMQIIVRFGMFVVLAAVLVGCGTPTAQGNQNNPPAANAPAPAANAPAPAANAPAPAANAPADPTAESSDASNASRATIRLEQVASDLQRPVYLTHAADGSGRIFIVEKAGTIAILRDGQIVEQRFLDITDRVGSAGNEQGLLSVAFHPSFRENGFLYVNYTNRNGDTVVARFTARDDLAAADSEQILLTIEQPYANHNGGLNKFGPDGYLYIGMGDGGSAGDPQNYGQDTGSLLGKMLRIDVDNGEPYAIPATNPLIDGERNEIWATGLRNPWRFSFDRVNGDMFIADVGQNRWEEINRQPASSTGGENYGWRVLEGNECFRGNCDPADFTAPIHTYTRDGGCSVTGGYVYRGASVKALQGSYIYGDYCTGQVWRLTERNGQWQNVSLLASNLALSSFGEDEAGELYMLDLRRGSVFKVVAG
jgi:glucose/arabinose dehydrogenase